MTLSNGELLSSVLWDLALSPGRGLRVRQPEGLSAGLRGALQATVEGRLDVARHLIEGFCMCETRYEMSSWNEA